MSAIKRRRRTQRVVTGMKMVVGLLAFSGLVYGGVSLAGALFGGPAEVSPDDPQAIQKILALPEEERQEALRLYGHALAEKRFESPQESPGAPGARADHEERRKRMEGLTPEERSALHEGSREVFQAQMKERIDAFFALPESERQKELDRQLDEVVARMKEWQKRRESSAGKSTDRSTPGSAGRGQAATNPREPSGRPGEPTLEQRNERFRERLDESTPEERAKQQAFFDALRARALERGITLPFGGGQRGGRR